MKKLITYHKFFLFYHIGRKNFWILLRLPKLLLYLLNLKFNISRIIFIEIEQRSKRLFVLIERKIRHRKRQM